MISVWLGLTAIHSVPVVKPAILVGGVRHAMITHNQKGEEARHDPAASRQVGVGLLAGP